MLVRFFNQWADFAEILREKVPENATWGSSLLGVMKCSWPGTACFMLTVEASIIFRLYNPPVKEAILILIAMFLVVLVGNMVDQIWDINIDRVCAPHRPLPSGMVSSMFVWHSAFIATGIAWICADLTGSDTAVISILALLATLFLLPSVSGCNKVLGEFLLAVVYTTAIWVPPLILEHISCKAQDQCDFAQVTLNMDIWPLAIVTLLFHFQRDIALDIADVKGDTAGGLVTIPAAFGSAVASWAVVSLLALCILVATTVMTSIWYPGWPTKSRLVFFASTTIFIVSCAAGFLFVMIANNNIESSKDENRINETTLDINSSEEVSGEEVDVDAEIGRQDSDGNHTDVEEGTGKIVPSQPDTELGFYAKRRSQLRRLMKVQLVGYVCWVMVNALVGY